MKAKIKNTVIASVLAISLIVTGPIKQAYAFDIIGTTALAISLLQMLNAGIASAQDKQEAILMLRHQFATSSVPSNSTYRVKITYEGLSDICAQLNQNGLPCAIYYVSSGTFGGYVIRCTGEPYNMKVAATELIDPGYTYTNKYYSIEPAATGGHLVLLYAAHDSANSLLNDIKGILNSWSGTNGILTTINSNIDLIARQLTQSGSVLNQVLADISSSNSSILSTINGWTTNVSNIATRTLNTANRLTTTVNGTAYSAAQLLYNIWGNTTDIKSLITDHLYVSAYTYDTNSTDYPHFTISSNQADELVAYLNATYIGKSMTLVLQDNSISNTDRIFEGANIVGGVIRVRSTSNGSSVNYFLITPQHYWFSIDANDKTTKDVYNKLDNVVGYIDGLEGYIDGIEGYIDNIEGTLSDIKTSLGSSGAIVSAINDISFTPIDYSSDLDDIIAAIKDGEIWVNNNTATLNGLTQIPISYQTGQQIVTFLNTEYVGKDVKFMATNGDAYESTYTTTYSHAYIDNSNNRIRLVGLNSSGNQSTFTLVAPARYVYVVSADPLATSLSNIETALYGTVETRSTALVPVGETALSLLGTFESSLTPLGTIGTIMTVTEDILDIIDDWTGDPDYSSYLEEISDKLSVTIDHTEYSIADLQAISVERLNDIYEWLDNNNLLDDQYVIAVLQNYGSYVTDAVGKYDNIINLFDEAWLLRLPVWTDGDGTITNDFGTVVDYFRDFYGEGQNT